MKKTHLRWILPLIVCVIAVGISLVSYETTIYYELVQAKENEIALEVSEELRQIDVDISRAGTVVAATGNVMSKLRLDDNRGQLVYMLENILEECSANYAIICDQNGKGFDHNGKDVDVTGEGYYAELIDEYANGGEGMILPRDVQTSIGEIMLVYGAKFSTKDRGYLVAYLPVRSLDEQLFREKFLSDKQAIISLQGDILCSRGFGDALSVSNQVWDLLPPGLSKDSVKLSISQKKTYMTEIPGYGYAVVEPLHAANGGALVLINNDQMRHMIGDEMAPSNDFALFMVVIAIVFVLLVLLAGFIGDRVQIAMARKKSLEKDLDVVTGLLSAEQTLKEIDSFALEDPNNKGMLFVIGTNITSAGDSITAPGNDRLREFARVLKSGFRASDVIGRIGEGEFAVFLKGIKEEKDIRKQTDEMQMFLHDVTTEVGDKDLKAQAGAVLFPTGGKNGREILEAGRRALTRAKQQGSGRLSF